MSDRPRHCIIVWVDLEASGNEPWVEIEPADIPDEVTGAALLAAANLYLDGDEEDEED